MYDWLIQSRRIGRKRAEKKKYNFKLKEENNHLENTVIAKHELPKKHKLLQVFSEQIPETAAQCLRLKCNYLLVI